MEASLSPVSKFLKTVVTASISLLDSSGDQLGEPPLTRLSPTPALLMPSLSKDLYIGDGSFQIDFTKNEYPKNTKFKFKNAYFVLL